MRNGGRRAPELLDPAPEFVRHLLGRGRKKYLFHRRYRRRTPGGFRMSPRSLRLLAGALTLAVSVVAQAAAPTKFSAAAAEARDFVAVDASTGYIATQGGGVWKTTDAGNNWSRTSLPSKYAWKIAVNPAATGRLYVATEAGVFRSLDAGASWTQLTRDPTRAVAISPASTISNEILLVGVPGVGVLKSTDSGQTFSRQSDGLDSTDVLGIVYYPADPNTAFVVLQCNVQDAVVPLDGNWGGVYRTTNANAATPNWVAFNTGLPVLDSTKPCANAIAANGTTVVVGIKHYSNNQGNVFRITSAAAASWGGESNNVFGVEFLGPDQNSPNAFFLGTNQFGTWRSTDGGASFARVFLLATDPDLNAQAFAAGSFTASTWVAGVYGLGVFRTTAGASPWSLPAGPVAADRVNDLANHASAASNTYYLALRGGSVMRSVNAGAAWSQFFTGLNVVNGNTTQNFIRDVQVIAAHPNDTGIVGLGVRAFGLYQLTGGTTWTGVAGLTGGGANPQSLVITSASRAYYSRFNNNAGLFRTTNAASLSTLAALAPIVPEGNAAGAWRVRASPSAPDNRLFLIMFDSLPYRSVDGGVTWARVNTTQSGFQRHFFLDIAEKPPGGNNSTTTLIGSTNKGIYRSDNSGANWIRVNAAGLAQSGLSAVVYTSDGKLWGGDYGGQLWCSTNDGANWTAVTGGNLGASIRELKVMNGQVHVLTDGAGFWKKDTVCP
jgi:photosystem II stability/assembly factor-like uncharacterized protein